MIDTVILTIPRSKTTQLDLTIKGVKGWDLQSRTGAYDKYVRNPSPEEAKIIYFPRLTYYKRKGQIMAQDALRVEFSVPKLIYQNNLDELADSDFVHVVEALRDRLMRMGIAVSLKDIENASVMAVHYSKNISLKGGYTARYVIGELGKVDINKRFDFTRARYINDGQSLYAYTASHSFVIYDKVADLNKGSKRSIDKDQPPKQLNLFERLDGKTEVLRVEARLSRKSKVNSLFAKLGFGQDPTFKDAFSSKKSTAVLGYYWTGLIEKNSLLLFVPSLGPKELFRQIMVSISGIKGKKAIYLTGLALLAKNGHGLRELRTLLPKGDYASWRRIRSDLAALEASLTGFNPLDWYLQVRSAIGDYKPLKTKELSTLGK